MRGENAAPTAATLGVSGTSPRARGKRVFPHPGSPALRNIPACAGKTAQQMSKLTLSTEHPRVRGENSTPDLSDLTINGTSPRARGKLGGGFHSTSRQRNIPAHAGKTRSIGVAALVAWEHPRARGENLKGMGVDDYAAGTSPRTRGKPADSPVPFTSTRNIPAHAGKTTQLRNSWA